MWQIWFAGGGKSPPVNSWNFSTFKRYLVYLGETTR